MSHSSHLPHQPHLYYLSHLSHPATLISMDDLKPMEAVLDEIENRMDVEAAEETLADYEKHGGVPLEQVVGNLGLK